MQTYRDVHTEIDTAEQLGRLAARAAEPLALLTEAGETEQAVLDAPGAADDWGPLQDALGALTCAAAGALLGRAPVRPVAACVDALRPHALPQRLRIVGPEGYLHYALDPLAYAASARTYAADAGHEHAARAVVIGIRSIGTTLSAVVAAALGTRHRLTLRPRGASGARSVAATPALLAHLRALLADGGDVLLVDEGPGATGETLACVAAWLQAQGVAPGRIVLLPSHRGGLSLAPEERRAWYAGVRTYAPPDEQGRNEAVCAALGLEANAKDLGWGQWRHTLPDAADLPAAAHHERRKLRTHDAQGRPVLVRYAGLGRWGERVRSRAEALADAGVGPAVLGASDGFLALGWTGGTPAPTSALHGPALLAAVRALLTAQAGRFGTGRAFDAAPLAAALAENAAEALGPNPPGLAAALRRLECLAPAEATVPDARWLPREWLLTPTGLRKVDLLDHGDGLRLPGPTHPAWDLAAASVALHLPDDAVADLAAHLAPALGTPLPRLLHDAAVLRPACAACMLGEAQLAEWEAGDPNDRALFAREAAGFREALEASLLRAEADHAHGRGAAA